jgi:hypothetical protein
LKSVISISLIIFAATGCATLGPDQGGAGNRVVTGTTDAIDVDAAASSPAPATAFPPQEEIGPRLIIPVTGGPPVIGIPVGGDLFIPVTGGPPVPGIPTGP